MQDGLVLSKEKVMTGKVSWAHLGMLGVTYGHIWNRETCISVTCCYMTCVKGTSGSGKFKN